jgi:hypothetical protein
MCQSTAFMASEKSKKLIRKIRNAVSNVFSSVHRLSSRFRIGMFLALLASSGLIFWLTSYFSHDTQAAWHGDSWQFRNIVSFGNSGSALTDRVVKFDIDTATLISEGKMQANCADSRFYDNTGKELKHFVDTGSTVEIDEDNITTHSTDVAASSVSFSHTVDASLSNTMLLIVVTAMDLDDGSDFTISSATYNSDALTAQVSEFEQASSREFRSAVYTRVAPDTGTNTLVVTFSESISYAMFVHAITLYNVDQSTPIPAYASGGDPLYAQLIANITSTINDSLLVGGGIMRGDSNTNLVLHPPASLISRAYFSGGASTDAASIAGYQYANGAGSKKFAVMDKVDWRDGAVSVVEVKPSSGGSTGCNNSSTDYYVLLPNVNPGDNIVYHYYGNPEALSTSQSSELTETSYTPTSGPSIGSQSDSPGPVLYYKFDEASKNACGDGSSDFCDSVSGIHGYQGTIGTASVTPNTFFNSYLNNVGNGTGDTAYKKRVFYDKNNDRWHTVIPNHGIVSTWSTSGLSGTEWVYGTDIETSSMRVAYEDADCVIDHNGASTYLHCATADNVNDDVLYYRRCELTGTTPYISCSTAQTVYDLADSADDMGPPAITIDSSRCVLIASGFEDNSKTDADEYEIWLWKEASTCGDGTWSTESGFPKQSIQSEAGYPGSSSTDAPNLGIASFGDLDAQLSWTDYDTAGSFDLETIFFDGDTNTVGTQVTLDDDIEGTGSINMYDIVTFGTTSISFGADDGTTDLDAYYITSKDGSSVNQTDTGIDVYASSMSLVTAVVDTVADGSNDVYVFAVDDADPTDIYLNYSTDGGASWSSTPKLFVDSYDSTLTNGLSAHFNSENCDIMLTWVGGTTPYNLNTKIYNTGSCDNADYPQWDTNQCVSGSCAKFDGINDLITVYNTEEIDLDDNLSSAFTVESWVRVSSDGENNVGQIFQKGTNTYLRTDTEGSGLVDLEASLDLAITDATLNVADALTIGKWHMVSMTYTDDDDDEISIYVDGKLAGTSSNGSGAPATDTNNLLIGGSSSANYHGFLDEFRIYGYERSENEIYSEFFSSSSVHGLSASLGDAGFDIESDLVAYWPMDENSSDGCTGGSNDSCDISGHGNDGAWNGGSTTSDVSKFGKSVTHDGNGGYISLPSTLITDATQFTVSGWIYFRGENAYSENWQGLFDFRHYLTGWQAWVVIYESDDATYPSQIEFSTNDGSTTTSTRSGSTTIAQNTWTHFTATFDKGVQRLFINGNLVAQATGINTPSAQTSTPTGTYKIAKDYISTARGYFYGYTDDFRLYKKGFDESEALQLYSYAPGPIGRYALDENSGTSHVYDSSGNDNILTMNGTMTASDWVPGKYGSALDFDGSNDYLSRTDDDDYDFGTGSFSVTGWFKHDTIATNPDYILTKSQDGTNAGYQIYMASDGDIVFEIDDDATWGPDDSVTTTVATYDDNSWHHFTAVKNGTSGIYLYIDGVLIASDTSLSATATLSNDDPLYIGIDDNGSSNPWAGGLDDIQLFNYALSSDQIVNVINSRSTRSNAVGSPVGSSIGYWSFDEGYGTTANNHNGTDYDLTLSSASWSANGKYSKALNGNGSVYASISDTSVFDIEATADYTISFWFASDSASNPGATEYIVNKANATTQGYAVYANTSGNICFAIDDDAIWSPDIASCSSSDLYDATWHHVVAIRDYSSSDKLLLYVDGVLVDSDSDTTTVTLANSLPLYVLDRDGTNNGDEFNGQVDELKIYNYALNSQEVIIDFNRASTVSLGSLSTESDGQTASNSFDRQFCVPGDTSYCSGPVAYYQFDENTGTTSTYDSSGNGRTLTLSSVASNDWSPAVSGSAISYNGSNSYSYIADTSVFDSSNISVAFWFKADRLSSSYGNEQTLATKKHSVSPFNSWSIYVDDGDDKIKASFKDSGGTGRIAISDAAITVSQWYHVTATRSANGSVYLYVNGRLQSTSDTIGNVYDGDGNLHIGAASSSNELFDGIIDDVKIYDYIRTQTQVAYDYNKGKPVAHYKFDECQGTIAYDSAIDGYDTASGNNGTINIGASGSNTDEGSCADGASTDSWYNGQSGKYESSLELDDTDDYVSITDDTVLDLASGLSLSAWVYVTSLESDNVVVSKGTSYEFGIDASGNVYFDGVGSEQNDGAGRVTAGAWNHIAVTNDDTTVTYYVNGVQTGTDSAGVDADNATAMYIGYDGTNYFDGQIDDVQIFNYPLTSEQMKTLYNGGAVNFR